MIKVISIAYMADQDNMKSPIVAYLPDRNTIKGTIVAFVSFAVVFIGLSHLSGDPISFARIANTDPTVLMTDVVVFSLGAVTTYYVISLFES